MVLMIGIMLGLSAEGLPICKTSDSLVMEEEGKEMSFELSCTNIMWDKYETNMGVLIALDPVAKLKICVDSGDDSCVPEAKASKLNMTRGHQNYTVRLLAEEEGITCVKLGSTYMVGNELQDPKAVELLLSNYNDKELERDTALAEDIPEVYTHIFEVEVDAEPSGSKIGVKSKNRSEERAAEDFESEEVEMVNGSLIEESYTKMVNGESALWEEVIVLTRAIENTLMARGTHFSKKVVIKKPLEFTLTQGNTATDTRHCNGKCKNGHFSGKSPFPHFKPNNATKLSAATILCPPFAYL